MSAALALCLTTVLRCQGGVDFERHVWPILDAHCVECHRAPWTDDRGRLRKPKGGLRLDGRAFILRGGDGGPVVVPGEPEESELLRLVTLDADDPDVMPAEGEPLGRREIEVLRAWIAGGAAFGDWTGAAAEDGPGSSAVEPPRVVLLRSLAEGLEPPDPDDLTEAVGPHGRATPVDADSPLVRVEYPGARTEVADADVRRLAAIAEHVTELDLGRSAITGEALATVARMRRLTRLDLHETAVSDADLRAVSRLPELRVLVLWGTPVTDAGLAHLAESKTLERLYVWQTDVTETGVAALRERLPGLFVHHRIALPEGR